MATKAATPKKVSAKAGKLSSQPKPSPAKKAPVKPATSKKKPVAAKKPAVAAKKKPVVAAKKPAVAAKKKPVAAKKPAVAAKKKPVAAKKAAVAAKKKPAAVAKKPAVAVKKKPVPAVKKPALGKASAGRKAEVKEAKAAKRLPVTKKPPVPQKPSPVGKPAAGKSAAVKPISKVQSLPQKQTKKTSQVPKESENTDISKSPTTKKPVADKAKLTPFVKRQHQRLLDLRDHLLDAMAGVARENLRSRGDGGASAFGMHQADAGSDAYDRDFALNLLSQEQEALYEIEEAITRVDNGVYGICEMSGKEIMHARLEAIPFARFTVECQAQVEREQMGGYFRRPIHSMFSDGDEDADSDNESGEMVDSSDK